MTQPFFDIAFVKLHPGGGVVRKAWVGSHRIEVLYFKGTEASQWKKSTTIFHGVGDLFISLAS